MMLFMMKYFLLWSQQLHVILYFLRDKVMLPDGILQKQHMILYLIKVFYGRWYLAMIYLFIYYTSWQEMLIYDALLFPDVISWRYLVMNLYFMMIYHENDM